MSPGNRAASVRARLLAQAKSANEEFELTLLRYACERFLYRLSVSAHRGRFVLKGARLLGLWLPDPYRATRDLDLLDHGRNDVASLRAALEAICAEPVPDDGVVFDLTHLTVTPIRAEMEHAGQRVVFLAQLGQAELRMQIDIGYGDALEAGAEEVDYPALLADLPTPRLLAYPREVAVAEKFEAMVKLGRRNSRMKDFHDVCALSTALDFDGPRLGRAVAGCFKARQMLIAPERPEALLPAFYDDRSLAELWQRYRRAGRFTSPPPADFAEVGERCQTFLLPVWTALAAAEPFDRHWPAGGPWA